MEVRRGAFSLVLVGLILAGWLCEVRAAYVKMPKFVDVSRKKGLKLTNKPKYLGACIGDYDRDGWSDMLLMNHGSPPDMYWSTGKGNFEHQELTELKGKDLHSCASYDLNGDGRADFIITQGGRNGQKPAPVNVLLQTSDRKLEYVTDSSFGFENVEVRGRSISFVDFAGRGLMDLLLVNARVGSEARAHMIYRNLGDGRFAYTPAPGIEAVNARWLNVFDVDGDGYADLFFMGFTELFLWKGRGDWTFEDVTRTMLPNEGKYDLVNSLTEIDFDQDGKMEVFLARGSPIKDTWARPFNMFKWRKREGFVDISEEVGLNHLPVGKYKHATNGDFNNDGFEDLWVSSERMENAAGVEVFDKDLMLLNQRNGKFKVKKIRGTLPPKIDPNLPPRPGGGPMILDHDHTIAIDLDMDGRLDAVSGFNYGRWVYYRNRTRGRKSQMRYLFVKVLPPRNKAHRDPMGAKVVVHLCNGKKVAKRVGPQGASHHQSYIDTLHFGVGNCKTVKRIEVTYAGGMKARRARTKTNSLVRVGKKNSQYY